MAKQVAKPTAANKIVPADADYLEQIERDAGRGQAKHAEDKILPFLRVLQPLSPPCIKKGPAYINGAEPGDFWLTTSSSPIIKGEDGVVFQPCMYRREWIEWVPRDEGGGFAGRWPYNYEAGKNSGLPDDAARKENAFGWYREESGHDLVDTI